MIQVPKHEPTDTQLPWVSLTNREPLRGTGKRYWKCEEDLMGEGFSTAGFAGGWMEGFTWQESW